MKQKYYITTPIYYPSGNWHLGHCYTTVCCDALARFKRLQGYEVHYLTGTDEHGQKIEQNAAKKGLEPKVFVDGLVDNLKQLWELMDISYDQFIRTTDESHKKSVQYIFDKLYEKGDIYKSEYEGLYCTPCESFWTDSQLAEGKCPDCGREVSRTKEESYFFRLSKYQDRVEELLTKTGYLEPESRVNEMVNNFIKPGLTDLSVSRTSFKWGVPVSFDSGHVIYVWIDALSNYITALGYPDDLDGKMAEFWPADIHMMAKEIVRFHSIIWPALLMAMELPLPKKVYGHGWLLFGGDKMSKSKGNVVDPFVLVERYGLDAIRYYLLCALAHGADGVFTTENLINKINADLVNSLGNLVSRTVAMTEQYFGGVVPKAELTEAVDGELINIANGLIAEVERELESLHINKALEAIMKVVGRANKYIDETMPWVLNKEGNKSRLSTVIYNLCETLRLTAIALQPFLTRTPDKIFGQLGITDSTMTEWKSAAFGQGMEGLRVNKGEILFPRLKLEAELEALEKIASCRTGC